MLTRRLTPYSCRPTLHVTREKLGLDAEGGVADHFLIACREAASGDAHRRASQAGRVAPYEDHVMTYNFAIE